jgi:hypothetical protein
LASTRRITFEGRVLGILSRAIYPAWEFVFAIPTVADGKVFVGTRGRVDMYGLLKR